jgi:hypothetical protein
MKKTVMICEIKIKKLIVPFCEAGRGLKIIENPRMNYMECYV